MNWGKILAIGLVFFTVAVLISGTNGAFDRPSQLSDVLQRGPAEVASPFDRVKEDQIHVYNDKVVLEIKNAEWATFADTNSMDPVIDAGANAIEIIPKNPDEIHVGDIISYESKYADGTIIHRVIEIGEDSQGWYCIVKGDNLSSPDPGRIRFNQIKRVVVAIIY